MFLIFLYVKDEAAKNEISKDVSSLANSVGGTLIYGIAELKQRPTKQQA